ncbi:MAG: hypothetical protein AAFO29_17615 [Actinomycetota bacterium]
MAVLGIALLAAAGCGGTGETTSASADEPASASTSFQTDPDEPTSAGDGTGDGTDTDTGTESVTAGTLTVGGADAESTDDPAPADDAATDDAATDDDVGPGVDDTTEVTAGDGPSGSDGQSTNTSAAPGQGTTTTVGTPPPTTAVPTADIDTLDGPELEEFVASRYEAFWDAFGQARANPSSNPAADFPVLAELATDEQLDAAHTELVSLADQGQALRRPDNPAIPGLDNDGAHRIRVDRLDDAAAELTICFVNDRISYQVADGAIINDAVVTVTAEATMVRTGDTWKLVRSRAVALDPGVAGCWLEDESRYPW